MRQECVFYQVSKIPYKFVHVVFIRAIPNFNLPQGLSPGNTTPCGGGAPGLLCPHAVQVLQIFLFSVKQIFSTFVYNAL